MLEFVCPLQFSFHATLTHSESTSSHVTELLSCNINNFPSIVLAKNVSPHINSIIHCLPQRKNDVDQNMDIQETECHLLGCGTGSLELTNWTLCLDKLKIQFSHFLWTSNLVGWAVDCSTQSCMGLFTCLSQGICSLLNCY
jgi:hypothetical protein